MILVGTFLDASSSMAGLTTADNGLSVNPAGNVQLGGPLIMTTQIDLNAFTLEISGTQADTSFLTNFINSTAFSQFQTVAQVRGTTDAAQLTVQAGNVVGSAVIDFHLLNAANLQTGVRIDESIPGIQIEDNISLLGLQYRSDYSVLGLTDPRWIPDLGGVEQIIGATVTADNGLNINTGTNIELGGPILKNTSIDTDIFDLNIGDLTGSQALLFITQGDISMQGNDALGTTGASFDANSVGALMNYFTPAGNQQLLFNGALMRVNDSANNEGLTYAADYSAVGLLNPRWLPDLAAVQGLTFYLADGTLNNDRFVDFGTHGLFFTDSLNSNMFFIMEQSTPTNPTINLRSQSAGTGKAALDMDAGTLRLQIQDAALTNDMGFSMRPTGWELTDNINLKGMVYVADYTAAQLIDPRAITDVGGVKQLIGRSLTVIPGVTTSTLLKTVAVPAAGAGYLYRVSVNMGVTAGADSIHATIAWTDANGNAGTRNTSSTGPTPGTDTATVFSVVAGSGTNLTVSSVAGAVITADFYIEIELIGQFS